MVLLGTVLLLVGALWTDVQAHRRVVRTDSALAAAKARLVSLRKDVARTTFVNAVMTNQRKTLEFEIDSTLGQLGSVNSELAATNVSAYLQGVNLTALHTCLGGVQNAMAAIDAQKDTGAAQQLSAVSGACSQLNGGANAGLVYPFDFPDPDVVLVGQTYYAYASNSVGGTINVITSTDLGSWKAVGNALPGLPSWANPDHTWAPAVVRLGDTYVMYYAVQVAGSGIDCISAATSAQPQGPFVDRSAGPLECQPALGGSIDPAPFFDPNGSVYLIWKSDGGGKQALWSEPLAASGTSFLPGAMPTALLAPDRAWEDGNIEAPDLAWAGGRYWLFFSGNAWTSSHYAIGVASCAGPSGPCSDASPDPILASGDGVSGPGGESVFADPAGRFHIAFHAWVPGNVGFPNSRDLYIRPLDLSGAVPVVKAPS